MKQIVLITDGCSNVGMDPAAAASYAREQGIVVHVVGVVDTGEMGERGRSEIASIASSGGGMHRIVESRMLAQTMQMMTRKTVAHTVQHAVQKELRQLLGGSGELESLPPAKRAEVVRVMNDLEEETSLEVALLIDASASMKPKLSSVEDAIHDLTLSLQARRGESRLAVFHFPGNNGKPVTMDTGWTTALAKSANLFYKINMRGTTPTGPALWRVCRFFKSGRLDDQMPERDSFGHFEHEERTASSVQSGAGKEGLLRDYII